MIINTIIILTNRLIYFNMGIRKTEVNVKKLLKAKDVKNDEFYTQYKDVENIINEYLEDLKDKIIYCNCDLEWSNFVKYFKDNKDIIKYKEFYHTGLTNEFIFGDYGGGILEAKNLLSY